MSQNPVSDPTLSAEPIPYAVIAAAVASILPGASRVVSIRPSMNYGWSVEGRRLIFASHQLPRR